jgi:hypothetical protein
MLIVCEGEKTEVNYFKAIRREKRLPDADIEIVLSDHGTSPLNTDALFPWDVGIFSAPTITNSQSDLKSHSVFVPSVRGRYQRVYMQQSALGSDL